ncbi:solute carrier family 35 member F6 isoform X3 [Globicephala melas]|uniref:Solute carrier family 35 member F6 isoform X4 n=1 Tax=Tursiops truncatus TaxID=9739 RepID=A0A6J3PXJ9_TURTR|nr:solute carrier family 35 member F6 isoform X4 [Lagenorhynchus obliquidens]XP_030714047.1 solute carrier family 35 member F6 isoform X3 [Globicephala melas]XP_033694789.1 solute carrier family 35 member F6 isoform X4 [Tursiops truncatus]
MAWTKYQLFLAGLMLVTGSINTLSAKWADNFVAPGCGGSQEHSFQHPFLQAVGMFLGELFCLAAFYLLLCRAAGHPDTSMDPQQPFNPLLFLPPALCDMTATSIMYVGDLLIIMAQIIVSIQMVLEEKFVYKHNVHPLRAVGTEGLFGFVILSLLLVPMYYIPAGSFSGNPRGTLEDALDAFCQVGRQPLIALALLGNISSIAFFNFAGISVTKELSATTRMVLDSLRTIVIWAVSLTLGWEAFHPLQILGFLILLTGTALYNGLHRLLLSRLSRGRPPAEEGEHERLLGGPRTAINDAS